MKNIDLHEFEQISQHINSIRPEYYINNKGMIYSKIYNKFLLPRADKDGYLTVDLYYDKSKTNKKVMYARIHVLVNYIFNGPPKSDIINPVTDHIDGNRQNNYYKNLRWLSKIDNNRHENCHAAFYTNITPSDICDIYDLFKNGKTKTFIASKYNTSIATIRRILAGRIRKQVIKDMNLIPTEPAHVSAPFDLNKLLKICYDLMASNDDMNKIAIKHNTCLSVVKHIKYKQRYESYTNNIDFKNKTINSISYKEFPNYEKFIEYYESIM